MKPLPVDKQKPLLGGADHDDLIMWLAYKEAKGMIPFDDLRNPPMDLKPGPAPMPGLRQIDHRRSETCHDRRR